MTSKKLSCIKVVALFLFALEAEVAVAQISGGPSANCHVTDGTFTVCGNGQTEWSDVQPVFFPASNSFLYVNQDPKHTFLYLMYDFPSRTSTLAATDSVHIHFGTVETESGSPALVFYDVLIPASGPISVLENGQPTPAGSFVASAGFGPSPNSSTPHITAEFQVPLVGGLLPGVYSPDPIFWGASAPPAPAPPPPLPTCANDLATCTKTPQQIKTWRLAAKLAEARFELLHKIEIPVCLAAFFAGGPAVAAACELAFFGWESLEAAKAGYYNKLANDPTDPNFTVIATPVVPSLSVQPLTTATGLSSQAVSDLNSVFSNSEQEIALLQVIPTCINRANGAAAAGNTFWQAKQTQAARLYASQLIPLLQNESSLNTALTSDFSLSGLVFTFSSNDVVNDLSQIAQSGLPAQVTSNLTQLGLDTAGQATVLQEIVSLDPTLVASLGVGAFPQALSDPSFTAATNNAIDAFSELAAATIFNDFGPDFGSNNSTNGNGMCVSGNTTPNCGPLTYRWIAAPFTPSGTFTLGRIDLALGYVSGTNGAVLNLVNDSGGLPGATVLESWSVTNIPFSCPFCQLSPIVTLNSVSGPTLLSGTQYWLVAEGLAGDTLDFWWGSPLSGSAGTALSLNQGASWICCGSSAAFDVLSTPSATPPGPITTATAAVVEANANGDTVANLRGLAPTDAPTLQDQIQMIVQFRVIQNPSIDATQLTTQLVNSLPPSILPPGQANTIINAVIGGLVPPPPVISGMPGPGCSLFPPNEKLVQVADVTAFDAVGGIQPGTFTVTGTSNEPQTGPDTPEIVITPDGSGGFVVRLQVARLGTGTGRIYTLTATAANSAGVTTTVTSTCTVPHDQGN